MLPPELRSQFLASVATSSASAQPSAVLQTLLESAELRSAEHSPWWLADTDLGGALDLDGPFEAVRAPKASTRAPPELVQVPAGVRPSVDVAQRVMFNIAAVACVPSPLFLGDAGAKFLCLLFLWPSAASPTSTRRSRSAARRCPSPRPTLPLPPT